MDHSLLPVCILAAHKRKTLLQTARLVPRLPHETGDRLLRALKSRIDPLPNLGILQCNFEWLGRKGRPSFERHRDVFQWPRDRILEGTHLHFDLLCFHTYDDDGFCRFWRLG